MRSRVIWIAGAALTVVGLLMAWWYGSGTTEAGYRTAQVEIGSLRMGVSSTGKVSPVSAVQIGSQVSGQIMEITVDFNSPVEKNQVIAQLNPASFEAKLRAAHAELNVARASVQLQQAGLKELRAGIPGARAALHVADRELARYKTALEKNIASGSEYDQAVAVRDQARSRLESLVAGLDKQQAQVAMAKARMSARTANRRDRELDLENTTIRSPVDGLVIGKTVEIGQTVAASLQAPVLFTIAENLNQMQVEISVDEADIGRVQEGQPVRFTVDTYPKREFRGVVNQVRKSPQVVSNVVTYTVVAGAANPDLALLPGMTANVEIIIGERERVLKVPDAALRFKQDRVANNVRPRPGQRREANRAFLKRLIQELALTEVQQGQVREIFQQVGQKLRGLREGGTPPDELRDTARQLRTQARKQAALLMTPEQREKYQRLLAERQDSSRRRGQVWVIEEDGQPQPVEVEMGISDGSMTEVASEHLTPGREVIVGTRATRNR